MYFKNNNKICLVTYTFMCSVFESALQYIFTNKCLVIQTVRTVNSLFCIHIRVYMYILL